MSDSSLAAAASAAEEWSDADFDLPDGPALIQHIEEVTYTGRGTSGHLSSQQSQLPQTNTKPNRPTYLRMSTGPEDIEEEDEVASFLSEDDGDNATTIKASCSLVTTASQSCDAAPKTGLITSGTGLLMAQMAKLRKAGATSRVYVGDDDEDWETDLDFTATRRVGGFKRPPITFAPPIREDSTCAEQDEDADVSTIKASRFPLIPATSESAEAKVAPDNTPLPPSPLQSPSISATLATMGQYDNDDDSLESAFELPTSLSKLSLRPLSHHASKATLSTLSEWASDTTTTATSATSEFFESDGRTGKATLSASPSTDFTTDEEDENEREAKEVEGLVLPESFLPKDLVRILDAKKKGLVDDRPAPSATSRPAPLPRSKHAEDEDDFEKGLLIGNDSELSPSRLLRGGNGRASGSDAVANGVKSRLRPKMLTVPLSRPQPTMRASSSQITLKRAKTMLAPPSAASSPNPHDVQRNFRSPSPQPRRSQESTTSSSAPSSKASVITLRRTKAASRATPPPSSFPKPISEQKVAKPKETSPPPLSHAYSMLTLPRIPGSSLSPISPSKAMKHQKSTSRLLVSPKSLTPSQGGPGKEGPSPMRLGRKASFSSLVDAEKARERISRERASKTSTISSGSGSGSGTTSASTSQAGSTGRTSSTFQRPSTSSGNMSALPRYNAPTASSLAKMAVSTERERPSLSSIFIPVPRPTTPIDSPGISRLTMPTASSRAKARIPVSAVFPGQTQAISPPSRQSSTSPVPMARVASPSRLRPMFPSARAGPKLMKKPKTARAYGDGTELDALDDLVIEKEKEQKFRVTPKATSNGSRIVSTSNAREKRPPISTSTATIGRKTPIGMPISTSAASVKRPPSRASEITRPTSAASTSTTGTGTLLRRSSRMDFASSTATIIPSSSATSMSANTASAANMVKSGVPLLCPPPAPAAYATLRRKRGSPKTETVTQRKPTLIRNLSGVGSPKIIGDMRWNPVTMRWEGNDSALRSFDSPLHSARPALITQLTGSSIGGVGSPTSSLLNGARIVGNMIFDPAKMCWINRYADDEPDPFAEMDDENEDKDATLGKRSGNSFRARSNTGNIGAPSLGTPLETVTGSPARSAVSRSSHRSQQSATSESEAESLHPFGSSIAPEDDGDDVASGSAGVGSPERIRRTAMTRGASTSPIPGVDAMMVEACHVAEARHRAEMKGWFPRRRAVSSASRNRRLGMLDDDAKALDRSYLYEIRTLATRQYNQL